MKLKVKSDEVSFEDWARAKYNEIKEEINPCDDKGNLDPVRLNNVLTKFAQNYAWAITIQEVESNKLSRLQHSWDQWYKMVYNQAFRILKEESGGGRPPGQTTIEARIVDMCGDEYRVRQEAIDDLKSRVELLKGFVRVLDRQASILQTLSSNMRSELFFSGGVSMGQKDSEAIRTNDAKTILRAAMSKDDSEGS